MCSTCRLVGEEYDDESVDEALELRLALGGLQKDAAQNSTFIEDDCLCQCRDQLVIVKATVGMEARGFARSTGSLVWATKITDFPAYCGAHTSGVRYGPSQTRDECECILLDAAKIADVSLLAVADASAAQAAWQHFSHNAVVERCDWARPHGLGARLNGVWPWSRTPGSGL